MRLKQGRVFPDRERLIVDAEQGHQRLNEMRGRIDAELVKPREERSASVIKD